MSRQPHNGSPLPKIGYARIDDIEVIGIDKTGNIVDPHHPGVLVMFKVYISHLVDASVNSFICWEIVTNGSKWWTISSDAKDSPHISHYNLACPDEALPSRDKIQKAIAALAGE